MRLLFSLLVLFCSRQALAQQRDSSAVVPAGPESSTLNIRPGNDTLFPQVKKRGFVYRTFSKNYPNPRLAALLSAVVPGAGQAYNKKWWKVPFAWGLLGTIGYFTFDTQKTYHDFRDSYKLLVDGDPNTNPTEAPYNTFDAQRTKEYRDIFRGYTEKWYIALGASYLAVVTDAFVDAHLTHFDVSDDLSLRLKPSFENNSGSPSFGLGIAFSFHKQNSRPRAVFATPVQP